MSKKELITLIESIGFKYSTQYDMYEYKEFRIDLWNKYYTLYNGSEWVKYDYNDLTPINDQLKKELRSIKLKELLK